MKKIIQKISFPIIARRDGRPNMFEQLAEMEKVQYLSKEQIQELQLIRLKDLLKHAYQNSPFYRNRMHDCGFYPERIKSLDDLKKIPVLRKIDIQTNIEQIRACNFKTNQIRLSTSGGTTGLVTKFYQDNESISHKDAAVLYFDKWTGWDIGEWVSLIWPATMDINSGKSLRGEIKNFLSKRLLKLALFTVDEKLLVTHIKAMRQKRASMIRGFPTPVTEFAKYVLKKKIKGFDLKGIVTTGESLYPHQRNLIEDAFGCKVFNAYRTREVGPIAQECEMHQGMHINASSIIIETIQQNVKNDKNGKILVTDLLNYGMPFIRYEIGDIGILSDRECECGRNLPILENVGGRIVDVCYAIDGTPIASITLIPNLVIMLDLFQKVQFVQKAIDHFVIRIEKPEPDKKIINKQIEIVKKIFGQDMKVSHEFVDEIPLLPSGKYQFVRCDIKPEKIKSF